MLIKRLEKKNTRAGRNSPASNNPPDYSYESELLCRIFSEYSERDIADIQFRTDRMIYLHTNRGLEILEDVGIVDTPFIFRFLDFLFSQRCKEDYNLQREATGEGATPLDILRMKGVIDFACDTTISSEAIRMRVQAHLSESGPGLTCRILRNRISLMENLGIDPDIADSVRSQVLRRSGLGLVTGATGSGKSTTLAAVIDWMRRTNPRHVVTIEDPIEFQYSADMEDPSNPMVNIPSPGFVTQQEVGKHTLSYQHGLKEALRKTPNVILLGEIRDRYTMETCIEAAQTGHFVLSTLHTRGAIKTMDRILEFYPREEHVGISNRLSETISFVLSQGLVPGFEGRVLVTEYLQNTTTSTSAAIRDYASNQAPLQDALTRNGNKPWNESMLEHFRNGRISEQIYRDNVMGESV
jgi:twitching motility protein PilT